MVITYQGDSPRKTNPGITGIICKILLKNEK
jgi:hypothetical protein